MCSKYTTRGKMETTMNLLDRALTVKSIGEWTSDLGLSGKALYNAQYRRHLSPAIAGDIAERLGEDVDSWIVVAALESERDSACKTRMVRRLASTGKRSFYGHQRPKHWHVALAQTMSRGMHLKNGPAHRVSVNTKTTSQCRLCPST